MYWFIIIIIISLIVLYDYCGFVHLKAKYTTSFIDKVIFKCETMNQVILFIF